MAGESAGAVYCHAHLTRNAPVQQYILSSGTLYLSPPQPPKSVQALRDAVLKQVKTINPLLELDTASVNEITEAVKLSGLQSFFLEWEEQFEHWQNKSIKSKRIMLGDVDKEVSGNELHPIMRISNNNYTGSYLANRCASFEPKRDPRSI